MTSREMRRHPELLGPIMLILLLLGMASSVVGTVMFGPHAFDSLTMLRAAAAGNLTATGNGTGLQIETTGFTAGGFIRVHVPQATGTTPTLDLTIQESDDNAAWQTVVTFKQIVAAGQYRRQYHSQKKWVRYAATITGTSPNFGAVQIGFETGSEYKGNV